MYDDPGAWTSSPDRCLRQSKEVETYLFNWHRTHVCLFSKRRWEIWGRILCGQANKIWWIRPENGMEKIVQFDREEDAQRRRWWQWLSEESFANPKNDPRSRTGSSNFDLISFKIRHAPHGWEKTNRLVEGGEYRGVFDGMHEWTDWDAGCWENTKLFLAWGKCVGRNESENNREYSQSIPTHEEQRKRDDQSVNRSMHEPAEEVFQESSACQIGLIPCRVG